MAIVNIRKNKSIERRNIITYYVIKQQTIFSLFCTLLVGMQTGADTGKQYGISSEN